MGTMLNNDTGYRNKSDYTAIPTIEEIDIDATEKVLEAATDMLEVVISGADIFGYLGLVDEITSIIANVEEAKEEIRDLNKLEIEELLKNVSEILKKFKLLDGESQHGIYTLKDAVIGIVQIIVVIKSALKDGVQISDMKYIPDVLSILIDLYGMRQKIALEAGDLQADEMQDLIVFLYGYIIVIMNS